MPSSNIIVFKFGSKESMEAFGRVIGVLVDLAEDMPWRPEIEDAISDARYVFENLKLAQK